MTTSPLPPELDHPAWLHGLSAFSSVRLHWGEPQFWPQHRARLAATCTALELAAPPERPTVPVEAAGHEFALLRLTVTPQGMFVSWRPLLANPVPSSVGAYLTAQQVHPQWGQHKTGNYLPYLLALSQARAAGAFEGLLTDAAGDVVDGARSGLLLRVAERWVVPQGGLPSITRAAYLAELGTTFEVRSLSPADLRGAEAAWLCGSGIGVRPVSRISTATWTQDYPALEPETSHVGLRTL